jgi:hypothetical protein
MATAGWIRGIYRPGQDLETQQREFARKTTDNLKMMVYRKLNPKHAPMGEIHNRESEFHLSEIFLVFSPLGEGNNTKQNPLMFN